MDTWKNAGHALSSGAFLSVQEEPYLEEDCVDSLSPSLFLCALDNSCFDSSKQMLNAVCMRTYIERDLLVFAYGAANK